MVTAQLDQRMIRFGCSSTFQQLMNEENEWDHEILTGVKEGPADCIWIEEVGAALKKMKRQSPRLVRASGINDTSYRRYWNTVDVGFM